MKLKGAIHVKDHRMHTYNVKHGFEAYALQIFIK
jgi:hypothetical protein